MKGLSKCKASESNVRRIQVKDIVKEVEDHLKTYSSAGMDISWYGYCKNLKKTIKTGQTRTRERKENTRAGRMLSKSYTSPKLLIGGNPQEGTWWHCKKHTGKRKFAIKGLKKSTMALTHGMPRWQSVCSPK
ncbi:hypothetical protein Tco_0287180 [Tanacetum coccineum]